MALELRPNCELCDVDLPPESIDARICSYECTFCVTCVTEALGDVCPNCGGGFAPRPIRPRTEWQSGLSVAQRPPSTARVHMSVSLDDAAELRRRVGAIAPADR